ncbi:ABC transporter ATP-binding protein [Paenalcaligenes hermetiae]|uniref:ABC transporter ATP-binding protein n=1 Tax=Paenalcaligenes hermetiae TaxID=1157987 RepID=A0ABP9M6Z0_9BURK
MERQAVVEFDRVSISLDYRGQRVDLLRQVSFQVEAGKTLGLVGESGAGKSMMGRVLSGLLPENLRLTNGEVRFHGKKVTDSQMRALLGKKIAFIPQEPLSSLNPVMSIQDQMFEHLKRVGVAKKDRYAYSLERLAEVGLPDPAAILGRYAHQLSGGQCQRVLIAMAFSGDPELIIADEPTTALDVITQAQIIRILREVQRRHNTAVILITHDLRLAAHVCDEVMVLYAGDVVEKGPAHQVLDQPRHPYAWALKNATPNLTGPLYQLPTLAEIMPGIQDMAELTGCRFIKRCPLAQEACHRYTPILTGAQSQVACLLVNSLTQQVPTQRLSKLEQKSHNQPEVLVSFDKVEQVYQIGKFSKKKVMSALKPLSLTVHAGELVGIVGESGSGKSTVARLMVGLNTPSSGTIHVLGRPRSTLSKSEKLEVSRSVQMIFQDPDSALNPRRKVWELVTQVLELDPTLSTECRQQVAVSLMSQVGIATDAAYRFPVQLSGGQKQRINIARALCVEPRLLVADEVVSGLDVSVQALIMNLLLRLNQELGIAVVFISHDLSVIRYLCTRVLVMKEGEVVEQGPTARVFSQPRHEYTKSLLAAVPPDDSTQSWPSIHF